MPQPDYWDRASNGDLVTAGRESGTPVPMDFPYVTIQPGGDIRIVREDSNYTPLNPGQARWLGCRLIEAAAIQEMKRTQV